MKLSQFIERNLDQIVDEWSEFAQTSLRAASGLGPDALRDHARFLLEEAVRDMQMPQNLDEQHQKSRGLRPGNAPELTRMARADAEQRFRQGFSLNEMVAEYRALRASVIRRWRAQLDEADLQEVDELTRFNETIDQAQTEAISCYVDRVEESRNLMLGVLGHDLRTPLGAARTSAHYLMRTDDLTGTQLKVVTRILSSTDRMRQMVDDLLDFTRTRLGGGLPLLTRRSNFAHICQETVGEMEASHPNRTLRMRCSGNLMGEWDVARVQQLVSNLLANAIQHGDPQTPVRVDAAEQHDGVMLTVHNHGPAIAPAALPTLFEPLMRRTVQETERREGSSGLGLGLFIVREIAAAHGGSVRVESSERDGTTFTVQLPRRPAADKRGAAAPAL